MTRLRLALLAVPVVAVACGGSSESAAPAADTSAAESSPAPAATDAGRSLVGLDVCALVPGEEVAAAIGGTLERANGNPGQEYMATCSYIVKGGDGGTDVVQIWLYPPSLYEPGQEMVDDQESLEGLGDRAYGQKESWGYQINVLKDGDVYIDTRADTPEQARKLAELTLGKL